MPPMLGWQPGRMQECAAVHDASRCALQSVLQVRTQAIATARNDHQSHDWDDIRRISRRRTVSRGMSTV